jgi:hypothetical protein
MLFLTKIDGYQKNKTSDTNKNVTKMGVKALQPRSQAKNYQT